MNRGGECGVERAIGQCWVGVYSYRDLSKEALERSELFAGALRRLQRNELQLLLGESIAEGGRILVGVYGVIAELGRAGCWRALLL